MIGSKNDASSLSANGVPNLGTEDDLEMVYRATKANKAVMDDGTPDDRNEDKKMSKIADAIDQASRVLFPLVFLCYNVFYWTYY